MDYRLTGNINWYPSTKLLTTTTPAGPIGSGSAVATALPCACPNYKFLPEFLDRRPTRTVLFRVVEFSMGESVELLSVSPRIFEKND